MLTDRDIKTAPVPPPGKQKKLSDGEGLYLLLRRGADGTPSYLWRLKFRFGGRESALGFGPWPTVTVEAARAQALEARRQIRSGQNPAVARQAKRDAVVADTLSTFGRAGVEYLQLDPTRADNTRAKHEWLFASLSKLHDKPLSAITANEVFTECRRHEAKGQHEKAHRVAWFAGEVFKYARRAGYTTNNPVADLSGALKAIQRESYAAITDLAKFGTLMRAIASLDSGTTRHALQLLALVATRPGEVCQMEWAEVDLGKQEWVVPLKRAKMRKAHWVPLSRQALDILKAQQEISGGTQFVFPQERTNRRPMSDGTLSAALAKLGYKPGGWSTLDAHQPHGFRSSFSTIMNAQGADPKIIELCLSHGKYDKVAAIYNRHDYQPARRALMQTWADLIDTLREGQQ